MPDPYGAALRAAVGFLLAEFAPSGIVVAGTIVRGVSHATSDLDLCVLREGEFRQRLQRWFRGVPAEIFVNPRRSVEGYMREEARAGRPITAHMYATGFVVLDETGAVAELRETARASLAAGPQMDAGRLCTLRYAAATQFEDACDVAPTDPDTARMILAGAVRDMLRYAFLAARRWQPRDKDLLTALPDLDPGLAAMAREIYAGASPERAFELAGALADATIGCRGFFEWESDREPV